MKNKIESILKEALPKKCKINVWETKSYFTNEKQFGIAFSIYNNQLVSLILNVDKMELSPQIFGGQGGQCIYRKPNLDLRDEKYLVVKSILIPFRKPKKEEKFVLNAIKRFAENWLKALNENKDVLMYGDTVNYNEILKG